MKVNPPDPAPDAPDAIIIIFGAAVRPDGRASQTLRHRVEAAARFGTRFDRPLFIPTGAKGRYGDAEATVMAKLLVDAGFPAAAIHMERTGTDTLSSVRAVARMIFRMVPRTIHRSPPVYACSSAYHLLRCLVLLRLAGVKAQACPPPVVPAASSRWLRWYWRLRETPALPYDVLIMLWLRVRGKI